MAQLQKILPSSSEIKSLLPLDTKQKANMELFRKEAIHILHGKSKKLALICGPCSVHDKDAILEYAQKFYELSKEVSSTFFCVLRFFIEKPRSHLGWKGFVYDPLLDGSCDMALGIKEARKLLLELTQMGLPCCMEFLDPLLTNYVDDLMTWGFIGSRTCSSQIHRQMASLLDFPVGFKNPACGDILAPILSAHNSSLSHSFLSINEEGRISSITSFGNPHTHVVLRGSNQTGNYDATSLKKTYDLVKQYPICSKLLVDCSHGNSHKQHAQQKEVFSYLIHQIKQGTHFLSGMMLESFLKSGNQQITNIPLEYGVSVTDSCLGWEETKQLILDAHEQLKKKP